MRVIARAAMRTPVFAAGRGKQHASRVLHPAGQRGGSWSRQWGAGALRLRHADAPSVGMATCPPQGVAKRSLATTGLKFQVARNGEEIDSGGMKIFLAALVLAAGLLSACNRAEQGNAAQEALQETKTKAEHGDAVAQSKLGFLYFDGRGVEKDFAEAAKWLRKAAEQGDAQAQYQLGACYFSGEGVEKDYAESVKWIRKAAEQGDVSSQAILADHYASGLGVEKDHVEAVKWYRKAAEQGDAKAQDRLGAHYAQGVGVEKDYAEALKWYRKAAEQGYTNAQNNLGVSYHDALAVC